MKRRDFLAGLLALLVSGCEKKPTMPHRGDYNISQLLKKGDVDKYYEIREKIPDNCSKVYYDLEFLVSKPDNSSLIEQVRKDREWLEKQKDNREKFWHAYLLYMTGKKEEAFEKATKLNEKFGFVKDKWGVFTSLGVGNHYTWEKTNYLLGMIYANDNNLLKATYHLSAIDSDDHYDTDPKQDGSRATFKNRARKFLKSKGIVKAKPEHFLRPILQTIAKECEGQVIVPYSSYLLPGFPSLQINPKVHPSVIALLYEDHKSAEEAFLKLKDEKTILSRKPKTPITYSGPNANRKKGPVEKHLDKFGPSAIVGWRLENGENKFRIRSSPKGTLGWGSSVRTEREAHDIYYQKEKFLAAEKDSNAFYIYDFGYGYNYEEKKWLTFSSSMLEGGIVHDVRDRPAFQVTLTDGNYIEIQNFQKIASESLYNEALVAAAFFGMIFGAGIGPTVGAEAPVVAPPSFIVGPFIE